MKLHHDSATERTASTPTPSTGTPSAYAVDGHAASEHLPPFTPTAPSAEDEAWARQYLDSTTRAGVQAEALEEAAREAGDLAALTSVVRDAAAFYAVRRTVAGTQAGSTLTAGFVRRLYEDDAAALVLGEIAGRLGELSGQLDEAQSGKQADSPAE
jgi:hypothetical protein